MTINAFTGYIAGIGTTSGTRLVLGIWDETPLGSFADAMIETADGHRILVAPRRDVADFIATTYSFDEVVVTSVRVTQGGLREGGRWQVTSNDLNVTFTPGRQMWMSPLLGAVPPPVRRTAAWARFCSPIASRLMTGVQTYGTASSGRDEWYAAHHVRNIDTASVRWRGEDRGELAPLTPPVRFGFASAPARPSLTALTSYVREP